MLKEEAASRLDALRRSLVADPEEPFELPAWMQASYDDPEAFWKSTAEVLLAGVGGAGRSSLFESYALFHEFCARHPGKNAAFVQYDGGSRPREISFAELTAKAEALASHWRSLGVEPGASIAVVFRFSIDYVVALLAAWHCGAIAAPIPPLGETFVRLRLEGAKPDFVCCSNSRSERLRVPSGQFLPSVPPAGAKQDRTAPHKYASKDPAARFFSPLGSPSFESIEVNAERLYLGALRDGALLLLLSAGMRVAAPGFGELQFKPSLLLAALSTGAGWVELGADVCRDNPDELSKAAIDLVGIGDELRDALLSGKKLPGRGLRRWFRNPASDSIGDAWARFARLDAVRSSLAINYFPNPAAAGAIVCSPWRADPSANTVLAAPGAQWQIADVNLSGMDALGDSGILASKEPELGPQAIGRPVLAKSGGEWIFVTMLGAHREGQVLPAADIAAVVKAARREVWDCCLVDYPGPSGSMSQACAVVVFAKPAKPGDASSGQLATALSDAVALELGQACRPDRVSVVHLAPRRGKKGEGIDREWCRGQFLSGTLGRKEQEPVFRKLGQLKYQLERGEL